jgi:hypothetical protein
MESVKHLSAAHRSVNKTSNVNTNRLLTRFNKQATTFEAGRFGWMAILIMAQSCLGSAACMYILKNNASTFTLATCAAITMGANAMFIALAKPKICLIAFYISVILNTVFIIQNL